MGSRNIAAALSLRPRCFLGFLVLLALIIHAVLILHFVLFAREQDFHANGGVRWRLGGKPAVTSSASFPPGGGNITTLHFFRRHISDSVPPSSVQGVRRIPRTILLRPPPSSWLPNIVVYVVSFPFLLSGDDNKCLKFGNVDEGTAWSSPYSLEVDLLYILDSMVDKGEFELSVLEALGQVQEEHK